MSRLEAQTYLLLNIIF